MFITFFVFNAQLDFSFFGDAVLQDGLLHWISLSCHCTLVGGDFVSFDQDGICWHLHALVDLHHISNQNIILMDFHQLPFSDDGDSLALVGHAVQCRKLPLLRVVVSSSNQTAHSHCHQYHKTFNPCSFSLVASGSTHRNRS